MSFSRDWSELQPELLDFISKKLGDITYFIRFRAVCRKWKAATSISDPPPQLPWLLNLNTKCSPDLNFYNLIDNETHTITIPKVQGKYVEGPSHGYLLSSNVRGFRDMFLLNPLTKDEIPLSFGRLSLCKLIRFGPNAIENDEIVVTCITHRRSYGRTSSIIEFWKPKSDGKISRIEWAHEVKAIAYYHGKMFIVDGDTSVINVSTGKVITTVPCPQYWVRNLYNEYLIEVPGRLLRVFRRDIKRQDRPLESFFDIYELVEENGNFHWSIVNELPGLVLFLDPSQGGIARKASDHTGVEGNCIFFVRRVGSKPHQRYYLCKYKLDDGNLVVLPRLRDDVRTTWFVPSLV